MMDGCGGAVGGGGEGGRSPLTDLAKHVQYSGDGHFAGGPAPRPPPADCGPVRGVGWCWWGAMCASHAATLHKEVKAWHVQILTYLHPYIYIHTPIYIYTHINRSVYKTHVEALHFAHIDKDLKVERCVSQPSPPSLLTLVV